MPGKDNTDKAGYRLPFAEKLAILARKPYLDIHVADHCNLRCAGCLHFAPLAEPHLLGLDAYEEDLERLASIPDIGEYFRSVNLMGGEPLLHPQLDDVIRLTRNKMPETPITLGTNGLLLKRAGDGFWDALVECDVVLVLSAYPIKLDYEQLEDLAKSHGARVRFAADVTGSERGKEVFWHLAIDPEGSHDSLASFTACRVGGSHLQLRDGRIWPCQVAAHGGPLTERFGFEMEAGTEDSLALDGLSSCGQIEEFRRQAHPICRFCTETGFEVREWRRSECEAAEWLAGGI